MVIIMEFVICFDENNKWYVKLSHYGRCFILKLHENFIALNKITSSNMF